MSGPSAPGGVRGSKRVSWKLPTPTPDGQDDVLVNETPSPTDDAAGLEDPNRVLVEQTPSPPANAADPEEQVRISGTSQAALENPTQNPAQRKAITSRSGSHASSSTETRLWKLAIPQAEVQLNRQGLLLPDSQVSFPIERYIQPGVIMKPGKPISFKVAGAQREQPQDRPQDVATSHGQPSSPTGRSAQAEQQQDTLELIIPTSQGNTPPIARSRQPGVTIDPVQVALSRKPGWKAAIVIPANPPSSPVKRSNDAGDIGQSRNQSPSKHKDGARGSSEDSSSLDGDSPPHRSPRQFVGPLGPLRKKPARRVKQQPRNQSSDHSPSPSRHKDGDRGSPQDSSSLDGDSPPPRSPRQFVGPLSPLRKKPARRVKEQPRNQSSEEPRPNFPNQVTHSNYGHADLPPSQLEDPAIRAEKGLPPDPQPEQFDSSRQLDEPSPPRSPLPPPFKKPKEKSQQNIPVEQAAPNNQDTPPIAEPHEEQLINSPHSQLANRATRQSLSPLRPLEPAQHPDGGPLHSTNPNDNIPSPHPDDTLQFLKKKFEQEPHTFDLATGPQPPNSRPSSHERSFLPSGARRHVPAPSPSPPQVAAQLPNPQDQDKQFEVPADLSISPIMPYQLQRKENTDSGPSDDLPRPPLVQPLRRHETSLLGLSDSPMPTPELEHAPFALRESLSSTGSGSAVWPFQRAGAPPPGSSESSSQTEDSQNPPPPYQKPHKHPRPVVPPKTKDPAISGLRPSLGQLDTSSGSSSLVPNLHAKVPMFDRNPLSRFPPGAPQDSSSEKSSLTAEPMRPSGTQTTPPRLDPPKLKKPIQTSDTPDVDSGALSPQGSIAQREIRPPASSSAEHFERTRESKRPPGRSRVSAPARKPHKSGPQTRSGPLTTNQSPPSDQADHPTVRRTAATKRAPAKRRAEPDYTDKTPPTKRKRMTREAAEPEALATGFEEDQSGSMAAPVRTQGQKPANTGATAARSRRAHVPPPKPKSKAPVRPRIPRQAKTPIDLPPPAMAISQPRGPFPVNRVLAYDTASTTFSPGHVDSVTPNNVVVRFDDGRIETRNLVELRLCEIRVGDLVQWIGVDPAPPESQDTEIREAKRVLRVELIMDDRSPGSHLPGDVVVCDSGAVSQRQGPLRFLVETIQVIPTGPRPYLGLSDRVLPDQVAKDFQELMQAQEVVGNPAETAARLSQFASSAAANASPDQFFQGLGILITTRTPAGPSKKPTEAFREMIEETIRKRLGTVIDQAGELYELTRATAPDTATRQKGKQRVKADDDFESCELLPAPRHQNRRHILLVADQPSKKFKYIMALALGIPCVSTKWVIDCHEQGSVLDWKRYMIGPGMSAFLGGVPAFNHLQCRLLGRPAHDLSAIFNSYQFLQLFKHKSFIFVSKVKSRKDWAEDIVPILCASGASRMFYAKVKDLQGADNLSKTDQFDYILLEDHLESNALLQAPISRKRKVEQRSTPSQLIDVKLNKIINWEWVKQCLISGYVLKPHLYTPDVPPPRTRGTQ